jgi:hypothetical protein
MPRASFPGKGGKGAMTSALEEHADRAVSEKKIPKDTLRGVLLAMTTPEGTRDHVELDVLVKRNGEAAKDAVFALTKARLVVAEKDGFTFVHDAVLREWSLLRGFIEDNRDDRLLVAHVERDAKPWAESKDPAALWRKGRLAAAIELWKRDPAQLSETARQFIAASAKEAQKAERARFLVFTLIAALIVGSALVYAKTSRDAADQARRDAEALAAAKQQAEEAAGEAAATAALLHDVQQKLADEQASYAANLAATKKKIASATSLDSAQKATADLAAPATVPHPVVPLPANLLGPSIPSPGGPGPSGGGAFDQAAIERVVNARKAGVKRTCLERSSSTASTTKVTATITIAPNGSVQNVSTAGDDPTVGKCIEQQLRTWSFPPPGDTKQVQIPFVFVRQ